MELDVATRRSVTRAMTRRYVKGSRAEKSAVLDQLMGVTGWHRDHARKALRVAASRLQPARRSWLRRGGPRTPVPTYGPEVIQALRVAWAVLDGPTGKRLAPMMAELVASLGATASWRSAARSPVAT